MREHLTAVMACLLGGCVLCLGAGAGAAVLAQEVSGGDAAVLAQEASGGDAAWQASEEEEQVEKKNYPVMMVDLDTAYQTIESFGTSGAWWSQYVGGFTEDPDGDGVSTRDAIATLLFDREEGIGLTAYRYNLGAGSADSGNGVYSDVHRRAQSFETEAGVYDWSKDENAVWFLEKAVELGVEEVILFCNSPLERLTDNGMAYLTEGTKSNLSPENYEAFAVYVMDVAEHFLEEGIPVAFLSPINEPQWEWIGGQEGCHYEPEQLTEVYLAFLDELESRESLTEAGVKLSGPESGDWGSEATVAYTEALLGNERLAAHFDTIDNHSYWSDDLAKTSYSEYMQENYPDVKLRMSEWCEMVSGSDATMDSAFHLAEEIAADLRILNVVSWQNWVGVAPGGYRDGLIYIDEDAQTYKALKRLWSFGNYSRYVRPGYTRVDIAGSTGSLEEMLPTAFAGTNDEGQEELVMVFINEDILAQEFVLAGCGDYDAIAYYETSDSCNLECTFAGDYTEDTVVTVARKSVTTVILTKRGQE